MALTKPQFHSMAQMFRVTIFGICMYLLTSTTGQHGVHCEVLKRPADCLTGLLSEDLIANN